MSKRHVDGISLVDDTLASKCARGSSGSYTPLLYDHAIQSILKFFMLSELAVALCVSKAWNRVAQCMQPIQGVIDGDFDLVSMSASPLARHVGSITTKNNLQRITELLPESIQLLAVCCKSLTHLSCYIRTVPSHFCVPYLFPVRLEWLKISVIDNPSLLAQCVKGVARCSALRSLALTCEDNSDDETPDVDFECFHNLPHLTSLSTDGWTVSTHQLMSMRRITALTSFSYSGTILPSEDVLTFLKCPSEQRLQYIDTKCFVIDDAVGLALSALKSLTKLDLVTSDKALTQITWLGSCSALTNLCLNNYYSYADDSEPLAPDQLYDGLATICHLKHLYLRHCSFTAQHLTRLTSFLPCIKTLHVESETDASFFPALGVLRGTLRDLQVHLKRSFQPADLEPLHVLINLKRLVVMISPRYQKVCDEKKRVCDARYTPPSTLMPKLEEGMVLY
jgi:hypothetical protein